MEVPRTPNRATSEGPSAPTRNSMEDADSSVTRKRPRLDSGDRSYRSMSADGVLPASTASELGEFLPTAGEDGRDQGHPPSSGDNPSKHSLNGTPSKVTINVRDKLSQTSPSRPSMATTGSSQSDDLPQSSQAASSNITSTPPRAISLSSSPARSPEIEVAEIEDMDDDPRHTKWKPMVSLTNVEDLQISLLDSFPGADKFPEHRQAIAYLAQALEKGEVQTGQILSLLAEWIENYLEQTRPFPSQWWTFFTEARDFWDEIPVIMEGFLRRNVKFEDHFLQPCDVDQDQDGGKCIQDFLVAYAALSTRMIQVDCQTLKENAEDTSVTPDLISPPYIQRFMWIPLPPHSNALWKVLKQMYGYDSRTAILATINRFSEKSTNGIQELSQYILLLLDRSQTQTSLLGNVWSPLNLFSRITDFCCTFGDSSCDASRSSIPNVSPLLSEAFTLFKAVDTKLQAFISKQISTLTLDLCKGLVVELGCLLRNIMSANDDVATATLPNDCGSVADLSKEDRVSLIEAAWKYQLLRRCIKDGRMEIRVQGVDSMQQELVAVYNKYIAKNKAGGVSNKIVQYLSDLILEDKLVDYLVGVDSHPQLIQRSTNIVGFLVVTGKYTEVESDVIWKTVASSQDTRTIDAILEMVTGFLSISQFSVLLYLSKKLNELPIRSFDGRMVIFCGAVLEHLRIKWRQVDSQKLDMSPYNLCIRLIREATSDTSLSPNRKREIYNFAISELHSLLALGPSDADKNSLYQECIADVAARSPFATGSIASINALLAKSPRDDIELLAGSSNLTSLIIGEFAATIDTDATNAATLQSYSDPLAVRLNLVQQIIVHIPDSITPELGNSLWNSMLGAHVPSDLARDAAWAMLERAARSSHVPNKFLNQCIQCYLPQADVQCLTSGVLLFAEQVIQYESRTSNPIGLGEARDILVPGGELLWYLSLSVPQQNLGEKVIQMLVSQYIGGLSIRRASQDAVNEIHVRMVERCIRCLTKAASRLRKLNDGTSSGEEDSMVIVASEKEVQREKFCFVRSLSILKEFLREIRSRSLPSPSPRLFHRRSLDLKGERMCIRYQPFSGGSNKDMQTIEVGDLETFEELTAYLVLLTGFSKFTVIAGGQKLDPTSCHNLTLRELKLDQKGLLLIKKSPDATYVHGSPLTTRLRPLEVEVMKHFQELHDLLGIDEQLGKDVFDFLVTFPPHEAIVDLVCSENASVTVLFPPEVPYKGLYSVYALKASLTRQLQDGSASQELILHGIHTTVAALTAPNSHNLSRMEITTAKGLVDCLLNFLKEPVSPDVSARYFVDPPVLINHLHRLINATESITPGSDVGPLIRNCFATMLESSLHSKAVFVSFKTNEHTPYTLEKLLLEAEDQDIRNGVAIAMKSACVELPTSTETKSKDFISFFWENVLHMIPRTSLHAQNTEQFFDIALEIFRSIDENDREELPLARYILDWSDLLFSRENDKFVGRDCVDWVTFGLTGLIDWCIQLMKSSKKPLNVDGNLMKNIFRTHLFPDVIGEAEASVPFKPLVPVLHSPTRGKLYSILLALGSNIEGYEKLLDLVGELLPQGEESNAWSWGFAQIAEDYHYEANWNFERLKAIRSPTGYPGLRNLSNTCYLNSLFTQLFMNVGFRGFMLSTDLVDGEASQKLLSETKKLFSYMQGTWLKSVDPQGIADSGINYENSPIDVHIQMDVEEFYNLLFARWESQLPSEVAKKKFGQFYGGKIVQQIHAKPCDHISDKLEPFSAIQCEVQGKASLAESLSAYIGGEAMEGDNKYACSGCGTYREAMKRASFKDVPDNLIFHLKRFEYDVATGTRNKINERFEFPEVLDMTPYNVEHLSGSERVTTPDLFNLVGVLVHSGTAESGHYYSYIRERPVNPEQPNSWLEFNDADVSRFDPNNIADQCFGGWSEPTFSQMRFPKPWNAYMLFYQRASSMVAEQDKLSQQSMETPVKEEVPLELQQRIALDNALWMRKFCLFDPEHAKFAGLLLEQLRGLNKKICSEDHVPEKQAIWLALDHVDQILSRTKDSIEYEIALKILADMAGNCTECCKLILDWMSQHEHALRNLLLRNPDPSARKKFSKMVVGALQYLREHDPRLYGFDTDLLERDPQHSQVPEIPGAFHGIIKRLNDIFPYIHLHSRAWDDYFGLLQALAGLGRLETHVMLREGFLKQCLEILVVDHPNAKKLRMDVPHYGHYLRLAEKGRKYSFHNLTGLMDTLLRWVNLDMVPIEQIDKDRNPSHHKYPLSRYEDTIMRFGAELPRSKNVYILEKILNNSQNIEAGRNIIRMIAYAEPNFGILSMIVKTISGGINIEPANLAESYLHAALAVCEAAPGPVEVEELINLISHEVDTIGLSGGEEHLYFFQQARRIRNDRFNRKNPYYFHRLVLNCVPLWAPTLLMYPEVSVREDTIGLLRTLVFDHDIHTMDDEQQADEIEKIAKELCHACLKRIADHVIQPGKTIDVKTVQASVQVVKHCLVMYFNSGSEEDQQVTEEAESILEHLTVLTVSTPDDALSGEYDSDALSEVSYNSV